MLRPRSPHPVTTAVALVIALLAGLALLGARAEAAEARRTPSTLIDGAQPWYSTEGHRWERSEVLVYSNWEGGTCVIDGNDMSSGAPAIPTEVLDATLQASLAEINGHLRGGLRLRYAGTATRALLCSTNEALPIVVGFATAPSTGTTLLAGSRPPGVAIGTLSVARVLIRPTGWIQICPDEPRYRELRHVVTHELLHAIGVGHTDVPSALMRPTFSSCDTPHTMQPDDVAAVNALYPPVLPATPAATATPTASATATPTPTATPLPAAPPGTFSGPVRFSSSGQALAVFSGGSTGQLETAARAEAAGGAWVQDAIGRFRLLVVDGPPFLRQEFAGAFPAGLWSNVAVTLVR